MFVTIVTWLLSRWLLYISRKLGKTFEPVNFINPKKANIFFLGGFAAIASVYNDPEFYLIGVPKKILRKSRVYSHTPLFDFVNIFCFTIHSQIDGMEFW